MKNCWFGARTKCFVTPGALHLSHFMPVLLAQFIVCKNSPRSLPTVLLFAVLY